jgi:hypothetical protein
MGAQEPSSSFLGTLVRAVLVLFGMIFGLAWWFGEGHGLRLSTVDGLHPGMSREQVIAIAGRPSSTCSESGGAVRWFYTRCTFCMIRVSFSTGGRVSEVVHDH